MTALEIIVSIVVVVLIAGYVAIIYRIGVVGTKKDSSKSKKK